MDADLARIEKKLDELRNELVTFMLRTENRITKVETKTLLAGGVIASVLSTVIGIAVHAAVK